MNKHQTIEKALDFDNYLKEKLKDKKFKKGYNKASRKFNIAYKIMSLRLKNKLSQKSLAQKLGTQQSVVARMEAGQQNFTVATLERIAEALKASLRIELTR